MVTLYTDSYFHVGMKHLTSGMPCQDYAIAKSEKDFAYAIVSDGCSSGRHTDVGARMISLSTAKSLQEHWNIHQCVDVEKGSIEVETRQNIVLAGVQEALGLISQDMLATCVYAFITPHGGWVHVAGDGAVIVKYRDGRILLRNYEWQGNMPYYPAYKNGSLKSFIKAHGGNVTALRLFEEEWHVTDGEQKAVGGNLHALSEGMQGITIAVTREEIENDIEFIAVFSDGVTQIDGMDWKDAVVKFLAFKNTTGAFAKRRMIRGIKDAQKVGKGPIDDIAYAVIRVDQGAEEEIDHDKDTEENRSDPGWTGRNYA